MLRNGTVKGTAMLNGLGTESSVSSIEFEASKEVAGNNTRSQLLRNTMVKGNVGLAKLDGGPFGSSIHVEVSKKIPGNTGTSAYVGAGRVNGTNVYIAGVKTDRS